MCNIFSRNIKKCFKKNDDLVDVLAASQNNPNSAWEAKAVEFFKDKLKEKDAHTWVMRLYDVLKM